jgi:hypothetical protein
VNVVEKFGDGWWKVSYTSPDPSTGLYSSNSEDKQMGLYPSNYLQEETSANEQTKSIPTQLSPSERFTDYTASLTVKQSAMSPFASGQNNLTSPRQIALDISAINKCESVSSTEKEAEYLRVIFPHVSNNPNDLSVCYNEVVKLIEDDADGLECDKSWITVFNSQGVVGMIPSGCVEPLLDDQLNNFVFVRRPTCVGLFSNYEWYFGNITRFETILLLNKYAKNGEFLVRDSDVRSFLILILVFFSKRKVLTYLYLSYFSPNELKFKTYPRIQIFF